jgi:hypothetical protein
MRRLLAIALLFVPTSAAAEETWDQRTGWITELTAGNAIGIIAAREGDDRHSGVIGDATITLGFHHISPFHEKGLVGLRAPEMSWCMPLMMCGGITGLLLAPTSSFAGNEMGLDVVAHGYHGIAGDAPSMGFGLGIRPALRVARDSRFRTSSYFGSFAPEIGFAQLPNRRELYLELNLYPIAMKITDDVAIQWDLLRERIGISLSREPVTIMVTTALSVVVL